MKLLIIIVLFLTLAPPLFAQTATNSAQPLDQQLDQKQRQIEETERKLSEVQDQEQTLKTQLETLDGHTRLTELKIEATTLKKQSLAKQVQESSAQTEKLTSELNTLEAELRKKLAQTEGLPIWDLVFPWEGFSKIRQRYEALQKEREKTKNLIIQIHNSRKFYQSQEDEIKKKTAQSAEAEIELKKYQGELALTKGAKEDLIRLTKNDETTYKRLIAQLKEEIESIDRAISNLGLRVGNVTKGQQIGTVGLTGCTSGPHLHFEAYENAKVEGNKVIGSRVSPRRFLEQGILSSPLKEFPGAPVTVEFGEFYALGRHTGIDIAVPKGTPALASADGVAYAISDRGCRVPGFDHGESKGVVIDHGNGTVSLYWHLN